MLPLITTPIDLFCLLTEMRTFEKRTQRQFDVPMFRNQKGKLRSRNRAAANGEKI